MGDLRLGRAFLSVENLFGEDFVPGLLSWTEPLFDGKLLGHVKGLLVRCYSVRKGIPAKYLIDFFLELRAEHEKRGWQVPDALHRYSLR